MNRLKRRRFPIIIAILVVILLVILIMLMKQAGRHEDLFKELPEETFAGLPQRTDQAASSDAKETSAQETETLQMSGLDDTEINENTDREQQEAAMETMGSNEVKSFYYEELTKEIKERINGKSYGESCTVPYEELRYVSVLYWGFDDQPHTGEMIVNKAIADDVIAIFSELYEAKYPIERMVLVDEYDADDNISMAANNSSAFNYRVIEGTNRISKHSYGLAIDINPLYNPYVHEMDGERVVTPVEGAKYEDRSLECPYFIQEGDTCYQAFIKRGFTWGGEWKNNKDYQHFQKELTMG